MIQNVSNYHKSERSRNKKDLPYFIVLLLIIWGLPGLVWSFLGEKLRFIFFTFTERLELIKGRKQFHTAPHLRFDKLHHNKRIALQLQRCILGSCAYLCSFSWVPDPILSRRKSLLTTKLAFPGMRFHLKRTMNHCEPRFDDKMSLSRGQAEWDCRQAKEDTAESREVVLTGNGERPWNLLASLDLENRNFVLGTTEELSFAALSYQSIRLFYAGYLTQVIPLAGRKSTSLFNSDM